MSLEQDVAARRAALKQQSDTVRKQVEERKKSKELVRQRRILEEQKNPKNTEAVNRITNAMDDPRVAEIIGELWIRDIRTTAKTPLFVRRTYPEITDTGVTEGIIQSYVEIKNLPIPDQEQPFFEPLVFMVNPYGELHIQAEYEDTDGFIAKTPPVQSVDQLYDNAIEFFARKSPDKKLTGTPLLDIFTK